MHLLKRLIHRRQLLLSGLALAILTPRAVQAKEKTLTGANPHTRPAPPAKNGKRIVMIDPGHGGIDSGAVGEEGSEEKHIVLEIAGNVQRQLQSHPRIEVRLTRDSDHFIPLYQRVEIAHQTAPISLCRFMPTALPAPTPVAPPYLRSLIVGPAAPWRVTCHSARTMQTNWAA